jgi:hypothetical protein
VQESRLLEVVLQTTGSKTLPYDSWWGISDSNRYSLRNIGLSYARLAISPIPQNKNPAIFGGVGVKLDKTWPYMPRHRVRTDPPLRLSEDKEQYEVDSKFM